MLMALTLWLLAQMGVEPSETDFQRYDREFRERGHHVTLDFGGQRTGTTRWTDDQDFMKRPSVGIGYEYLIDRRYHGVGFEVLAQSIGKVFDPNRETHSFFVGGGLAYYPIRHLRVFTQAGAEIALDDAETDAVGRLGLGYRFMFFMVGMQPYAYVQTTSDGQFGWALNFRFEY